VAAEVRVATEVRVAAQASVVARERQGLTGTRGLCCVCPLISMWTHDDLRSDEDAGGSENVAGDSTAVAGDPRQTNAADTFAGERVK
jgi:hypothetical protein